METSLSLSFKCGSTKTSLRSNSFAKVIDVNKIKKVNKNLILTFRDKDIEVKKNMPERDGRISKKKDYFSNLRDTTGRTSPKLLI